MVDLFCFLASLKKKRNTSSPHPLFSAPRRGPIAMMLKISLEVDGLGYFRDFVHDREVKVNKLVTFSILKKFLDSKKLG